MAVTTKFEEEVARQRYRTLAELRNRMDLTWLKRKNYEVIKTKERFDEVYEEMMQYALWGVDTETTGLKICSLSSDNPLKDKLAGICISWKRNQGIYLPLEHTLFQNLDKRYVLRKLRKPLESKTIATHNGLYDGKVFYDEGIRLNIKHDTLVMYFNIDSNVSRGSKGLKPLTEKKYNYQVIEFDDIFISSKDYGLFKYLPEDLVRAYACGDSDHTLQLLMDSIAYLTAGQTRSYALDIKVQNELIRSEYFGKGIDMNLCKVLDEINTRDLQMITKGIHKYAHYLVCKAKDLPITKGSYQFNVGSSEDVSILFYNLLNYEVLKINEKTGKPSVDKFVLKAMMSEKVSKGEKLSEFEQNLINSLEKSCISEYSDKLDFKEGEDDILFESDKFKKLKYKLPYLISEWRKLEKYRTSFFAPLLNNNFEGKYYSPISLARTQTARIMDPIQTMVGALKKLIVPYDQENEYLIDFDFAQIEYRVMAGLAKIPWLVEKLRDPEADYHREGGSPILGKAPEDITKEERSGVKALNFAIPYGMLEASICESLFGIGQTEEEFAEHLIYVKDLLAKWMKGLYQIPLMLDKIRDQACSELPQESLPEPLKGKRVSRISNPLGRTRLFYLDRADGRELEKQDFGRIRRQAGNYPIQSFAREIFCNAFIRLMERLKREGIVDRRVKDDTKASGYRFECDLVIIAYIHDECLMNVKKTLNPNVIQKYIYEECMQVIEGHPNYYCGINVIQNWYEGKSDIFEAPVGFVEELKGKIESGTNAEYDPKCNQRDWVLNQIAEWMDKRALAEVKKFQPDIETTKTLVMSEIRPKFKNYFIKPKMFDFFGLWRDTIDLKKKPEIKQYKSEHTTMLFSSKEDQSDDFTKNLLETYCAKHFGSINVVYESGLTCTIEAKKNESKYTFNVNSEKESTREKEQAQKAEILDIFSESENGIYGVNGGLQSDCSEEAQGDNRKAQSDSRSHNEESEDVKQLKNEIEKGNLDSNLTNLFELVDQDLKSESVLHF